MGSLVPIKDTIWDEAQDFYRFIHEVILKGEPTGFKPHAAIHQRLIYQACKPNSVTAAPRGVLKSTVYSRYRPLYRLVTGKGPDNQPVDYIILSETRDLAREHLGWIRQQIEKNDQIRKVYGDLMPQETERTPWNQDEIQLSNGNRAVALGYASQVRGRHPTDIIVDDLESISNMDSPEKLNKLKDWFYRVLMGSMLPETRLGVVGTIIARESLLTELMNKDGFEGKIYKALIVNKDGTFTSIWPERWTIEWLLERRRMWGTHRFNAEYQNEPLGPQDPIIYEDWIRRHQPSDLMNFVPRRRYITCDPAFTEERWGNYSAIVILDEHADGRVYERLAWRRKVQAPDLIRTLMGFWHTFSKECETYIGVEEVAAQKVIRQAITELDPSIPIIPLRPDRDKTRRLADVSRYFEAGQVSLSSQWLVEDILNFPNGDKDGVDALVYALKLYEQQHPIIRDGSHSPIDLLKLLGNNELEQYLERSTLGIPGYVVPESKQYRENFEDASYLSQLLEDGFE